MDPTYLFTPFLAWFAAGSMKFAVNSLKARRLAWHQIGYGGLPSTHSTIVSSTAALIALREGIDSAGFAVAVTLAFIVLLDAASLRRQIGKHAAIINRLAERKINEGILRERMGHTPAEILAGICLGIFCAFLIDFLVT